MVDLYGIVQDKINEIIVKPITDAFGGVADWAGRIPGMVVDAVVNTLSSVLGSIATSIGNGMKGLSNGIVYRLRNAVVAFFNTIRNIVFR